MKVLKEMDRGYSTISTEEIGFDAVRKGISTRISYRIMEHLSKEPLYPKQLAKRLGVHEQNVYYYIRKLEEAGLIKVERKENKNGTIANYYTLTSSSFLIRFGEFEETQSIKQKESDFLNPFIREGRLNSIIVVGSPDPHGPLKARSRDGYYGMDLALFIGSFLNSITNTKVKLDTEVTEKELEGNNIIVIGGSIVNSISARINGCLNINFDEDKKGFYSSASGKIYVSEEIGVVDKITNPFNNDKELLFVAGLRNAGTKASIISFLKYFREVEDGNLINKNLPCKVVEGFDLNSDGEVDDVEFLE